MTLSSSALEEKGALKDVVASLPDDDSDPSEVRITLDLLPPDFIDLEALDDASEELTEEIDEGPDEEDDFDEERDEDDKDKYEDEDGEDIFVFFYFVLGFC